jgi:hypothetical protein
MAGSELTCAFDFAIESIIFSSAVRMMRAQAGATRANVHVMRTRDKSSEMF